MLTVLILLFVVYYFFVYLFDQRGSVFVAMPRTPVTLGGAEPQKIKQEPWGQTDPQRKEWGVRFITIIIITINIVVFLFMLNVPLPSYVRLLPCHKAPSQTIRFEMQSTTKEGGGDVRPGSWC